MPVYHFTLHAHGTWLPDRPEGYYLHGHGWQGPDQAEANHYRSRMNGHELAFSTDQIQLMLKVLIGSQNPQRFELYAAAADMSHVHYVLAWRDARDPIRLRSVSKSSLSRALNQHFGKQQWFAAKGGRTKVIDEEHLHHLLHEYLPKHDHYWLGDTRGNSER